jgi:putative nucleotidyltransferase with HDIG domain
MNGISDDSRSRVLAAAVEIAEKNYDKTVNIAGQTSVIWEALGRMDIEQSEKNVIFQLLESLLVPTVMNDPDMTERVREDVKLRIPSVVREIRIGGVLVQRDQVVTPALAAILREQGYPGSEIPWKHLGFVLMITFSWSLWLTWIASKQEAPPSGRDWAYIAVVLIIDWTSQRWFARFDVDSLSLLATAGWLFLTLSPGFAFHVVLGGGLIGYILAFHSMTSVIAVGCIICGVASGGGYLFIKEAASRIMIWRNVFSLGLCLACTSVFVRWGFELAVTWGFIWRYLILCAFWSSLVVAVLPLWEYVFEIISPLRLLEMSHPSQPLLKRLQLEAPGTYHHTVTVGTLAEAVADKLGMNGLFVKTGAFYHDIGKLKRPHYFVENQSFGDNIHDRLAPAESAKVLLGHVSDGLKLADEYKLPQQMKNFIAEHHGKTCLTYFHQKAVAADKEAGGDGSKIDRADYCYPGPTPQRPETALLMIADSIEAAMKGLKNPLSSKLDVEAFVDGIINSKIMSGQFIDVDFTLKDISVMKNVFVEVLMSMYHTREIKPISNSGENNAA